MSNGLRSRPAHARLGASGSARWMACHGSPALEDLFGEDNSPFAAEGTLCHSLGAHCLLTGKEPIEFLFYNQSMFNVIEDQHDGR